MGYPTGDQPEHDPRYGHPQQGYPPPGYPQQPWPYQQPAPYNPQPGWTGGPPPGGKPPSGGNGRVLAIVGVVTVLLVAVLVAVTVIALQHNGSVDGDPVRAAGPSSVADTGTATTPSATDETPTTDETPSTADPVCPAPKVGPGTPAGWKTVSGKRGLAYDVPPNWDVKSCSTLVGWEGKCADGPFGYCPIRTMGGAATLESARCPKNSVGLAGTPGAADTTDINAAVRAEAGLVASIYTSDSGRVPRVSLSAPRKFTVGGAPAVQIVASVTGIETSACVGPTALHSMIATTVPGQQGTVLFVISLPQGVPGAVAPAVGDEMVSSLRRTG